MESVPASAIEAINHGVTAFQAGNQAEARALFVQALQLDADSELAWLWLATVATDLAEQRYCLNRAAAINPETPGLRRLAQLPDGPAVVPPEVWHLDRPPLPPDLTTPATVSMPLLSRAGRRGQARAKGVAATHRPHAVQRDAEADGDGDGGHEPPATPAAHYGWRRWLPWPPWLPWLIGGVALAAVIAVVAALLPRSTGGPSGEPYVIAYVGPLTGIESHVGREQVRAVRLAVNAVNGQGGIGGRPVELMTFNDQNDPEQAVAVAQRIVATDDVLLVIGHHRSTSSLAAAPIYEAVGLAAISPSSTVDSLTENNPWYFRTVLPNHDQGTLVAAYIQHALDQDRASIITAPGMYEDSLTLAFAEEFRKNGTVVGEWEIDPADREASIATIIAELAATDDPGIVFLPLSPDDSRQVLLALRRAGSTVEVIGGDALGYQGFAQLFAGEPEELVHPGYFTNGVYAVSTIIYDGLGGTALEFARLFADTYGVTPGWFGAKAHDAAALGIHALTSLATAEDTAETLTGRRADVRDALAANDSLETAIDGLSGPLYFDATHSVPQMLSFGFFDRAAMLNAPLQYRPVIDPEKFNLAADAAAGLLFEIDGLTFRQYRVVYVGVDINEVSNLDARAQTFDADFFLWFWYHGDDRAEHAFFTNSTDTEYELDEPLDRMDEGGTHFVIYRVQTTFFDPLDFRDYPWDRHLLTIGMQNQNLTNDDIVYVPDPANLHQSQDSRRRSAVDTTMPFNRIPSWEVERVEFIQDSAMARSTVPDPRTGAPEYDRFSTYRVEMEYARIIRPFLIKNLLPLSLLALVTYISLFFRPESAATRIGFSVTSILTTSVLLQSVSGNLPEIGYTVAIEWGYYVYIALSAVLVLINIMIDRWYKQKRYVAVARLDIFARVMYPAVILTVVAVYASRFW